MIGVFDSGIGGLSVLRELRKALPKADFTYFGDTANVPYGGRPDNQVTLLALNDVQLLRQFSPVLIVAACNAATSVAITPLREANPDIPIVGVVPVVKTLAVRTKKKKAVVITTEATVKSATYSDLKRRFAAGVEILELTRPEWVGFTEQGRIDDEEVRASVEVAAKEIQNFGADVVALGCTHFPFLRLAIETALPGVEILDSGAAVARQVASVLSRNATLERAGTMGNVQYFCSGDPIEFSRVASALLGQNVRAVQKTS